MFPPSRYIYYRIISKINIFSVLSAYVYVACLHDFHRLFIKDFSENILRQQFIVD